MVQIGTRSIGTEDIRTMICSKRAAIFPLSKASSTSMMDCYPTPLENWLSRFNKNIFKPRDDPSSVLFCWSSGNIVVRERTIKRILSRSECLRNKILSRWWTWIIIPSKVTSPISIPGTFIIRNRIMCGRTFSNPKNRCNNVALPRLAIESLSQWRRRCLRFHSRDSCWFDSLLTQLQRHRFKFFLTISRGWFVFFISSWSCNAT